MQKYNGSCHCSEVKFAVSVDLEKTMVCNCSHCHKKGFILAFTPATEFNLLSGEHNLTEYRFNKKMIAHPFCKTCGVQAFGKSKNSKGEDTVMINVRCLDDVDISNLNSKLVDGKSF